MDRTKEKKSEMVNYQNGKIYKLWSDQSSCLYIGSTTQSLAKRLGSHKVDITRQRNKTYEKMQGHTNIKIELIEVFPCNSREELLAREGHYIRLHREQVLNKCVAGQTDKDYREANKEKIAALDAAYYKANKEKIAARMATYYEANKEKIAAQVATYRKANKEKISARKAVYYEANKDKILAKQHVRSAAKKVQN